MRRRDFIALVGASAAAWPLAVQAQQAATNIPHIAFFNTPPTKSQLDPFLQGLADYGYVDGKNIVIDYFLAPTRADFPEYAAKAAASKPAVIVTFATPGPLAAKAATSTIPIVFTGPGDPIGSGIITNYQRPGGNLTGNDNGVDGLEGKLLAIAKELIPDLVGVAVMLQPSDPVSATINTESIRASEALGLSVVFIYREEGFDLEQVFVEAATKGVQALIVYMLAGADEGRFAKLALQYRLPLLQQNRSLADLGGLASYGNHRYERIRRVGYFVDLILKGVNPGDIPVERSTQFEFVVNLKTARALGLTVPTAILLQATDLIE
jgi:putative ABC transport system substrate-binding protein